MPVLDTLRYSNQQEEIVDLPAMQLDSPRLKAKGVKNKQW